MLWNLERKHAVIMCWTLPVSLFVSLLPLIVTTDALGVYLSGINLGIFALNGINNAPKVMGWVE